MGILNLCDSRVGVLAGGVSQEREISFQSAAQVTASLKRMGIDALSLDINTRDENFVSGLIMSERVNAAFIALHGEFGEDGCVQEILEKMDLPYTGSGITASRLAMDKIASKKKFIENNVPTPGFLSLDREGYALPEKIGFPRVVKPACNGSSFGVSIVEDGAGLKHSVEKIFETSDETGVIVEEYIGGREFTVGILDGEALGVVEIVSRGRYFDFLNKYTDGVAGFFAPARVKEETYNKIRDIAARAHNCLGCEHFSRVDIKTDLNGNIFVLEVNSIPGLTSHSLLPLSAACVGLNFDGLIKKMLELALQRPALKEKLKTF